MLADTAVHVSLVPILGGLNWQPFFSGKRKSGDHWSSFVVIWLAESLATKLAVVWPAIGVAASRRVLNRGRVLHRRRVLNWRRVPEAVLIREAVLVDHHGVDAMDVCGVGCDDDDDDDDDGADSGADGMGDEEDVPGVGGDGDDDEDGESAA